MTGPTGPTSQDLPQMNRYEALAQRWRLQSNRTDELHETLRTHSYVLLTELATELGVEARTWKEQRNPFHRRYVEYRLSPFPGSDGETRIDRYTPKGELEFAIVLTFDHGEDQFPKTRFLVPLATRMYRQHPQFCLWDPHAAAPLEGFLWVATRPAVIQDILTVLDRELAIDPFEGPPTPPRLGYL
ncbi:hypothetical protein [Synechococcus sp. BO 8801]|uniref:hypothetical protein n=1 Tax=Synechococcus sp. BO 8801 TaxID=169670 RepID=UPI000B9858C7|nr:hypothetical protein [Synechococcus sp. BO 8801]